MFFRASARGKQASSSASSGGTTFLTHLLREAPLKRLQLFEFEDQPWFPKWLRDCMTRYIAAFHDLLRTKGQVAELVARALRHTSERRILDLCSGGGGPMLDVAQLLAAEHGQRGVTLELSDLYPNLAVAERVNASSDGSVRYLTEPVDATNVPPAHRGVRTMICSLHHLPPDLARATLRNARDTKQPFVAFELSDNKAPRWLWWTAIPFAFLAVFVVTPKVRPLTLQQLVFTYLVPLIPLFVAWDGAVSNARTYTVNDLEELLAPLRDQPDYRWEIGTFGGPGGNKLWLLGLPAPAPAAG